MIRALHKRFDGDKDAKQPLLTPRDGLQPNYTDTNPMEGAA